MKVLYESPLALLDREHRREKRIMKASDGSSFIFYSPFADARNKKISWDEEIKKEEERELLAARLAKKTQQTHSKKRFRDSLKPKTLFHTKLHTEDASITDKESMQTVLFKHVDQAQDVVPSVIETQNALESKILDAMPIVEHTNSYKLKMKKAVQKEESFPPILADNIHGQTVYFDLVPLLSEKALHLSAFNYQKHKKLSYAGNSNLLNESTNFHNLSFKENEPFHLPYKNKTLFPITPVPPTSQFLKKTLNYNEEDTTKPKNYNCEEQLEIVNNATTLSYEIELWLRMHRVVSNWTSRRTSVHSKTTVEHS